MPDFLIFIILLFSYQTPQNDLVKANLKGKVKSITTIQCDLWETGYKPFLTDTTRYNPKEFKIVNYTQIFARTSIYG